MIFKRLILRLYNMLYDNFYKVYDYFTSQKKNVKIFDLLRPNLDGEPSFLQLVVVSRLLDIENYCSGECLDFYYMNEISKNSSGFDRNIANQNFINLIDSFKKNGYNPSSRLVVDKDQNLWNGTHRLAMCIYLGINHVNVLERKRKCDFKMPVDWLRNQLSTEDFNCILEKYNSIISEHRE